MSHIVYSLLGQQQNASELRSGINAELMPLVPGINSIFIQIDRISAINTELVPYQFWLLIIGSHRGFSAAK